MINRLGLILMLLEPYFQALLLKQKQRAQGTLLTLSVIFAGVACFR